MTDSPKQPNVITGGFTKIKEGQKKLLSFKDDLLKIKDEGMHFNALSDSLSLIKEGQKRFLALTDDVLQSSQEYLIPFQNLVEKEIPLNWKEYFDNSCKGEDLWGHYKTANGDLFIVADGASNHDETKTGGDVVQLIDKIFKKNAAKIVRSGDLKKLIHAINTESTQVNKGAYAAIAGILHRKNSFYSFSAGDIAIIAKKSNGKLLQVLPLDLNMELDEAEELAKTEIGTIVNGVEITRENYKQRINQYVSHALYNAIGFGDSFFLHEKRFNARDGAALLIASDGVTDPFITIQKESGKLPIENAVKIHEVLNSSTNATAAAEALHDLIWDTQVKEKKKIKPDDRTALFLYMCHVKDSENE